MEFHTFDAEYVRRLTEGDSEVERHFTAYFGQLLTLKLRHRLRSRETVEDVRQDTFLRVVRALRQGSIQHPERLGAFVNQVCNNVLLEHFRDKSRTSVPLEEGRDPPDTRIDPESELVSQETKRSVREVLGGLSTKDRAILKSIFLDERDREDVCREFQVERAYLRVLLHRAKTRFRRRSGAGKAALGKTSYG